MFQDELRKLEKEEEEEQAEEEEEEETDEEAAEPHPKKHRLNEESHKPGDTTEFCHLSKRAKLTEGNTATVVS